MVDNLRIDLDRLMSRIERLAEVGALEGGGVCRLAFTDEDRAGRDLLVRWMEELGLAVSIDAIGNIFGLRAGSENEPPVMVGSHIDTVATGGLYDGALGVLAGLEIVKTLNDAGRATRRPIAVAAFSNEEGARFQPDMMGSQVFQGGLPVDEAMARVGIDGTTVAENLERIGYSGVALPDALHPGCFIELHVEQGPILEQEGVAIGAVERVQGISWTEARIEGVANHAGTTPMKLRQDAGYAAAEIGRFVRELALDLGSDHVATTGTIELVPNLINVVANRARVTVDMRNTDEGTLQEAERRLETFVAALSARERVRIETVRLARFEPTPFDRGMVDRIDKTARALGQSVRRMPSGAGHDAQIIARMCPSAMIFVPSARGISHNVDEYTAPEAIRAGGDVLLQVVLDLSQTDS